ncbi:hypothetical protein [Streptomyces sp. NPDC014685]|uniref:hypothetical protein n=1 Tax=Streptomyces sp. NPDC014685 TaxID=3364881 RepID=UPI0037036814
MPYWAVDDGAHSHPKILRATNAAVGLWTRVGSYVAQHLTDGHVPGEVAKMYGSAPQIKKLVTVELWHEHGHTCPRCPAVRPGDYFMHDYRESGNPSRAEVLARRKRAAEKKQRQRAAQSGAGSAENPSPLDDDSSEIRDGIDEENDADPNQNSEDSAGHGDVSLGESPGTSRARVPLPSPPIPTEGVKERENSAGSSARASGPALSLIPADWEPSPADVQAAQVARADAGRPPLTLDQVDALTRKFVRRQLDDGRTAAAWGGRWRQWAETERPEPAAGGVVVPLPTGRGPAGPQSTADKRAAEAFALSQRLRAEGNQ